MIHNNCSCQTHLRNDKLEGFGAGELSLAQALTQPEVFIDKYKSEAIKYGLYGIVTLVVLNHIQLHMALNHKIKKFR